MVACISGEMWLYHYQVYTKILFINNDMLFLIVRNAIKIQVVVTSSPKIIDDFVLVSNDVQNELDTFKQSELAKFDATSSLLLPPIE